jgi:hypothetical protein
MPGLILLSVIGFNKNSFKKMESFSAIVNRYVARAYIWNYFPYFKQIHVFLVHFFIVLGKFFNYITVPYLIMGMDSMDLTFYYSLNKEKRNFLVDDHLDSEEFDFLQNFASDVDQLHHHGGYHAELCLNVINASGSNAWRGFFGPILEVSDT